MEKQVFKYENLYYINECELDNLKLINNKLYYKDPCWKCGGTGYISVYEWYAEGVCFECEGKGFRYKPLKTYKTLKGAQKGLNNIFNKEVQQKEKEEIRELNIINELKTIYIVKPNQDTKNMKEYLKDIGCVWSGKVWYKNNTNEFDNIQVYKINIEKEINENMFLLSDIKSLKSRLMYISNIINNKVEPILNKLNKTKFNTDYTDYKLNDKYEFNIKEVLTKKCYESAWGSYYYYLLLDSNNHKLLYKTSRNLEIQSKYKATIKDKDKDILIITRLLEIKNK